jgi:hypothetical protein
VRRAGSQGLKDQTPRSCPEWLLDSHGTREMLNDGNIPLGQEPWERFVRNWVAYATGELVSFPQRSTTLVYFPHVYVFNEIYVR